MNALRTGYSYDFMLQALPGRRDAYRTFLAIDCISTTHSPLSSEGRLSRTLHVSPIRFSGCKAYVHVYYHREHYIDDR